MPSYLMILILPATQQRHLYVLINISYAIYANETDPIKYQVNDIESKVAEPTCLVKTVPYECNLTTGYG